MKKAKVPSVILKGKICISKVQSFDGEYVNITISDDDSHIQFFDGKMSLEDLAKAVTGQGGIPIDFEARGLKHVGMVRETKPLVFSIPDEVAYDAKDWAEENAHKFADEGWEADTYFRSQNSIRGYTKDRTAHGTQRRFVKKEIS